MAVVDVEGAPPGGVSKARPVAPIVAAGIGIAVAIAGGMMLTSQTSSSPATKGAPFEAETAAPPPEPGPGLPGVQFDQPAGMPAGMQMGMELVVKFKDDGKVKDIVDAFWKDQPSARAKFEAFKAGHPAFAGLKLDRVTYSNELVLVHDGGVPAPQRLAAMREIAKKLSAVGDVSYAEPNMTAQAGGQ